ncbi:hypothetical protein HOY82DRAFT_562786 [Tuber indicum]|nr:hypothetical protein HOY82DRAFT_562786 [Tuber indicum]
MYILCTSTVLVQVRSTVLYSGISHCRTPAYNAGSPRFSPAPPFRKVIRCRHQTSPKISLPYTGVLVQTNTLSSMGCQGDLVERSRMSNTVPYG